MSTIPISVTEEQFEQHIRPYLRTAKRGYECKIALYKVFNYILKRLYTGCQWKELPIAPDLANPEKKKSLGKLFTITGRNGIINAAFNQIRQHSKSDVAVTIRLLEVLAIIIARASSHEQRQALLKQADMIKRGSEEAISEANDRHDIIERYELVMRIANDE